MTTTGPNVYAGIDTHADTHHVAVIDELGRKLGDDEFTTTSTGYQQILAFLLTFGTLVRVGIEGTASYGAGITAYLRSQHVTVKEVIRPSRQTRRNGKSDPIDAYAAARSVAADEDLPIPKLLGGDIDAIRVILKTRRTAVKARTAAIVQIKNFLITADASTRETYTPLSNDTLITTLATVEPAPADLPLRGLRRLARRVQYLDAEITAADTELEDLTTSAAPALRHAPAIGAISAAQLLVTAGENPERITSKAAFAALCGVSPIPASSGKTQRHRLNRGGDRQANSALHQIVLVRMSNEKRTQDYINRRRDKSTREVMRCLKRHVANEVYTHLTRPVPVPQIDDLRPLRKQKRLTLEVVAQHFGVWPAKISTLERGKRRDDDFAETYREFLLEAA